MAFKASDFTRSTFRASWVVGSAPPSSIEYQMPHCSLFSPAPVGSLENSTPFRKACELSESDPKNTFLAEKAYKGKRVTLTSGMKLIPSFPTSDEYLVTSTFANMWYGFAFLASLAADSKTGAKFWQCGQLGL